MGMLERMMGKPRVTKRPRGGGGGRDAYVPADPEPAPGTPPDSPADRFKAAGVPPPRPLVWVGEAATGGPIWSTPVANGVGLALWRELRAAWKQTRLYPVLTGDDPVPATWRLDALTEDSNAAGPDHTPDGAALLAAADLPPADVSLRTRLEPATEPMIEADLAGGYLALVPLNESWQLPIAVGLQGLGDWSARQHASVLRLWSERFVSEPVSLTSGGIDLLVDRPPVDSDAAYELAERLYAYCPDLVTRGTRTLWRTATTIAPSPAWAFRWRQSED